MKVTIDEKSYRKADAEQERKRDKMIMRMLNRLPLNESAEQLIETRFKEKPDGKGLHFIRLLWCIAEADRPWSDEILGDLGMLLDMSADDALAFMFYFDRAYDAAGDDAESLMDRELEEVMSEVYYCLPGHLRERMNRMEDCDAICEKYADQEEPI